MKNTKCLNHVYGIEIDNIPEGKQWVTEPIYRKVPGYISMLDLVHWALEQNDKAIEMGYDFAYFSNVNTVTAARVETNEETDTRLQAKIARITKNKQIANASWNKQLIAAYAGRNKVSRKEARIALEKRKQ